LRLDELEVHAFKEVNGTATIFQFHRVFLRRYWGTIAGFLGRFFKVSLLAFSQTHIRRSNKHLVGPVSVKNRGPEYFDFRAHRYWRSRWRFKGKRPAPRYGDTRQPGKSLLGHHGRQAGHVLRELSRICHASLFSRSLQRADRVGVEPTVPMKVRSISSRVP
jgi:hypothetical protein